MRRSVLSTMLAAMPLACALLFDGAAAAGPVGDRVAAAQCFTLAKPVAHGATIESDMLSPALCRDQVSAPTSYDRGTMHILALRDLAAGAYLGCLFIRDVTGVEKGAALTLVSRDGPVRIERVVTAMQSSRGGRVFVRDADGQVYSVALAISRAGQ